MRRRLQLCTRRTSYRSESLLDIEAIYFSVQYEHIQQHWLRNLNGLRRFIGATLQVQTVPSNRDLKSKDPASEKDAIPKGITCQRRVMIHSYAEASRITAPVGEKVSVRCLRACFSLFIRVKLLSVNLTYHPSPKFDLNRRHDFVLQNASQESVRGREGQCRGIRPRAQEPQDGMRWSAQRGQVQPIQPLD